MSGRWIFSVAAPAVVVLLVLGANATVRGSFGPKSPHLSGGVVRVVLTTADGASRLAAQPNLTFSRAPGKAPLTIDVDSTRRFQRMDGFGAAFTDTSAYLLETKLSPAARASVLLKLFSPQPNLGIGLNVMRVPIGASDFTHDAKPYSYDDLPPGQTDPTLAHFSIAHDAAFILPLIRAARALDPALKLLASPWSAPAWMKTNGRAENPGGSGTLKQNDLGVYAAYLARFVAAYRQTGAPIDWITPSNEPHQQTDYPGMSVPVTDEIRIIRQLGPDLRRIGSATRIVGYDDDWQTDGSAHSYPALLLADPVAGRYLSGLAFHCYFGNPGVMESLQARDPRMTLLVSECSSGIAPGAVSDLIIASARNGANSVVLWNLALDPKGGPRQGNGCNGCRAPVVIGAHGGATFTSDYHLLGQASLFIKPGAYRVAATTLATLNTVYIGPHDKPPVGYSHGAVDDAAFVNPDGSVVLLAYNVSRTAQHITVRWRTHAFAYTMPAGATATFTWKSSTQIGRRTNRTSH